MIGAVMGILEFTQHIYQEKKPALRILFAVWDFANRRTGQNNIQYLEKMLILFQTDILIFKLEI
jgi:hypothetical protein